MEVTRAYTRLISKEQNSLLWKMSLESGKAYNSYLRHYQENTDYEFCRLETNKEVKRKYLHSQSYQGAQENAKEAILSYFMGIKRYKK